MSAEILRRAAAQMRDDAAKVRRPYGPEEHFKVAVADWLEVTASAPVRLVQRHWDAALAVARAYLGKDAPGHASDVPYLLGQLQRSVDAARAARREGDA